MVNTRGSLFTNNLEVELVISSKLLVIYFQSICLLRVSADLEAKANLLHKEALQNLTIVLAGSDTKGFWDLLAAYFRANHSGNKEDDPWNFLDTAPTIPSPLPLTDTESEDEKILVKSAPVVPTTKVKAPRKPQVSQQRTYLTTSVELRRPFVCILLPRIASRRRVSLQSSRSSVNIRQLMQGVQCTCVHIPNVKLRHFLLRVPRESIPTSGESTWE